MYWKLSAGHFSGFFRSKWQKFPQNYPETWSMIWSPVSVRKSQTSLQHTFMKTLWCGNFSRYWIWREPKTLHFLFSIFSMGAKTPYSATKCAASLILTLFPLFSPSALIICSPYNRMGNIKMSPISKNQYLSHSLTPLTVSMLTTKWQKTPFSQLVAMGTKTLVSLPVFAIPKDDC